MSSLFHIHTFRYRSEPEQGDPCYAMHRPIFLSSTAYRSDGRHLGKHRARQVLCRARTMWQNQEAYDTPRTDLRSSRCWFSDLRLWRRWSSGDRLGWLWNASGFDGTMDSLSIHLLLRYGREYRSTIKQSTNYLIFYESLTIMIRIFFDTLRHNQNFRRNDRCGCRVHFKVQNLFFVD